MLLSDRELAKETFCRLHPRFVVNYLGEDVAIYQNELVDHDHDRAALLKRTYNAYPNTFVLVRQVKPEPEVTYEHHGLRWG